MTIREHLTTMFNIALVMCTPSDVAHSLEVFHNDMCPHLMMACMAECLLLSTRCIMEALPTAKSRTRTSSGQPCLVDVTLHNQK